MDAAVIDYSTQVDEICEYLAWSLGLQAIILGLLVAIITFYMIRR